MPENTAKPLPYLVPTLETFCRYHEWLVRKNYERRLPALIAEHDARELAKGDAK